MAAPPRCTDAEEGVIRPAGPWCWVVGKKRREGHFSGRLFYDPMIPCSWSRLGRCWLVVGMRLLSQTLPPSLGPSHGSPTTCIPDQVFLVGGVLPPVEYRQNNNLLVWG